MPVYGKRGRRPAAIGSRKAPYPRYRHRNASRISTGFPMRVPLRNLISGDIGIFQRTMRSEWQPIMSRPCVDNGGYQSTMAWGFTISNLPNFNEFTQLYDQYKIMEVKVKIIPQYIVNTDDISTSRRVLQLYYIRDHDDADITTLGYDNNENPWLENSKVKKMMLNRPITITVKPSILTQVYETLTSTGYSPKYDQWLDCNDQTVPHYGLKVRIYDPAATVAGTEVVASVYVEYKIALKHPR